MRATFWKYWTDLLWPVLRHVPPPVVPQAVVLQQQHVLLVKRDIPALWELPGGGMLPGEAPEVTVVREVHEETGLQVRVDAFLGWYERTGFRAHRSPVFLCCPTGGVLCAHPGEAVQVRFFPLRRLPRSLFPWYRPLLLHDVRSPETRPLQRTQHLGLCTVLHCLLLELGSRAGLLD